MQQILKSEFTKSLELSLPQLRRGSYEWIIMLEKCGRLDLTVFHRMEIEKIKILGAVLEVQAN